MKKFIEKNIKPFIRKTLGFPPIAICYRSSTIHPPGRRIMPPLPYHRFRRPDTRTYLFLRTKPHPPLRKTRRHENNRKKGKWRQETESNRRLRLCRPLHNHFAILPSGCKTEKTQNRTCLKTNGAGEESRTLDLNLGKVALYQLSYSRITFSDCRTKQTTRRPTGSNSPECNEDLEREKSLELSTSTLARLRSTN